MKNNITNVDRLATIIHELGHLSGYVLANLKEETSIGNADYLRLGKENCVAPKINLFHIQPEFKQDPQEFERIKRNCVNKPKRMMAWFLEVLMGPCFKDIHKRLDNGDCFYNCDMDFGNIYNVRKAIGGGISEDDILLFGFSLAEILKKHGIVEKSLGTATQILNELINMSTEQIEIQGEPLLKVCDELYALFDLNFQDDYFKLIDKWTIKWQNKF